MVTTEDPASATPEAPVALCPFLAQVVSGESHICLARAAEDIVINARYVERYCVSSSHVECSLFRWADDAARQRAATDPRRVVALEEESQNGKAAGEEQAAESPVVEVTAEADSVPEPAAQEIPQLEPEPTNQAIAQE